ncbi:hypothetical protein BpHYR1_040853 [Brachionus plicatilis]|uniref:Uncharacterized protein n=1 Tax=Brachionus plicatilis TaxID=10195 RepID=A0A3M7SLT6_BRAPC|nr:hypothetical protein BpHYR1_040853 [Brachionus plicatilis]
MRRLCEMFVSVRGIVYPKWVKQDNLAMDRNNNDLKSAKKWIIDKYVFSYSKHIEVPKKIKIKNYVDMVDNYNQHVQNCEFRVCKKLDHPFRLFPPYNENK